MTVYLLKATFSKGELSPKLHGRTDTEHYAMGLEICENFYVMKQGGITRRPGTVFVGETKDNNPARLMPFSFSKTQGYAVEMGDLYSRFFALDGQVELTGSPYEIVSPYSVADVYDIHYAQSADLIYMANGSYWPYTLTRNSETDWGFDKFANQDGPYLDRPEKSGTITPSASGAVTPKMTGPSTPSGTTGSGFGGDVWKFFDLDPDTDPENSSDNGTVEYYFDSPTEKIADAYMVQAGEVIPNRSPSNWKFQGYNGTSWITLDTQSEKGWSISERRYFEIENTTAYKGYRLIWTNVDGGTVTRFAELLIHEKASEQTPITFTFSSLNGINDGAGFTTADIGRSIRIKGADNVYRWIEITGITSTTVILGRLHGHALTSLEAISEWRLSAWNELNGFPKRVGFFEERLNWANTDSQPRKVWASKSADFDNYGISSPLVDDDAISLTMTNKQINEINFITEGQDLIVGASDTMRIIGPATSSQAFSATNARQRQQTTEGAADIQPVTIGNTLIYVNYYKNKLYEFNYSFELNGYRGEELSIFSDHIFQSGIAEMHYQSEPDNLLWNRLLDGKMGVCTYERNQAVTGMSRHFTGDAIESHCVVSTENEDRLWMVVRRTINGQTKRYVEYLSYPHVSGDDVSDAVYLDCSVTVEGAASTSVSGLDYLEGQTVGVLADGRDIGDTTVVSGSITLPGGVSASKVTVGLRYSSYAKTLRMSETGQRDGTGFSRKSLIRDIRIDLLETGAIRCGTSLRLFDVVHDDLDVTAESPRALVSGFYPVKAESKWADNGQIVMETNSAYPATIRAVVASVEGEP